MNFSDWCEQMKIHGNYREALYHSLCARYGMENIESAGENVWADEWQEVLSNIAVNLLGMQKGSE